MANEYYTPSSVPAQGSFGSSAQIRSEYTRVGQGFDKMPIMAGANDRIVIVNSTGTALTTVPGLLASEIVTETGVQTLTNKSIAWADNTFPGFGDAATKAAGTGADEVLLISVAGVLPAMSGENLTDLNASALVGVVAPANGGTGVTSLASLGVSLGIPLLAPKDSPALTGIPTAPTPATSDSSTKIATTRFVSLAVAAAGGMTPSDTPPLMDGVANPGISVQAARGDHVHPSDTSRAPASAATATGTSFTPSGNVAATNVQAAIAELDSEKAGKASNNTFTGTNTFSGPTHAVTQDDADSSTLVATTNFTQAAIAAALAGGTGMLPSNDDPLMDGVASPGGSALGSRSDHVHPTDTSRLANNVSATNRILGRSSAGAGPVQEIVCTAAGRALLDDADASAQRTTLGLGVVAIATSTTGVPEGSNLYFTEARVRNTVLTGLSLASSAVITSADSVLTAFGKLQAQTTDRLPLAGGTMTGTLVVPQIDIGDSGRIISIAPNTLYGARTTDGSDTGVTVLTGSSAVSTVRSARVEAYGNEHVRSGDIRNYTGENGFFYVLQNNSEKLRITTDQAIFGNQIVVPSGSGTEPGLNFADWDTGINGNSTVLTGSVAGAIVWNAAPNGFRSGADNTIPCGLSSNRWTVIYATTGSINTSDGREKTDRDGVAIDAPWNPSELTAQELAAATEIAGSIGIYKWKHAIAEKGDDARLHAGGIAQRVIEIMQSHGLNPFKYGFVCYDEWEDEYVSVQINRGATVQKTHEVERQKVERRLVKTPRVVVEGGVATLIEEDVEQEFGVFQELPVVDGAGQPVMVIDEAAVAATFDQEGNEVSPAKPATYKQLVHRIPVMETVEETYTEAAEPVYEDRLETPAGNRYGLRYDELLVFIAAGFEARIAALEAVQ